MVWGALASQAADLTGQAWLAPGADAARHFTSQPPECLTQAKDRATAYLVEVGRAAFRNPLILGEQAARQSLSCNSCHRNGHDNPQFFIKGLSGRPGTIDATSALFSKTLDDGRFNPLPIPSLRDAEAKSGFGSSEPQKTLDEFLTHVVEAEFQGRPPPGPIFDGLKAYIRHLKSGACPQRTSAPITEATYLDDVRRALMATVEALRHGHFRTADTLVLGGQVLLGRLNERYPGPEFDRERTAIATLAKRFQTLRGDLDKPAGTVEPRLRSLITETSDLEQSLQPVRAKSLFNPEHSAYSGRAR